MKHINEKQLLKILDRYNKGTASDEEKKFLETYSMLVNNETDITDVLDEQAIKSNIKQLIDANVGEGKLKQKKVGKKIDYRWLSAAAAILLVVAIGYLKLDKKPALAGRPQANPQTITPGGNKAFLILADGSRINLDAAGNGKVAQQAGISISKTASGQLSYTVSGASNQGSTSAYNTIETPKGGQYLVKLPDGTQVWLNAASSLKFPLAFSAKERKVVLTGEGYFEVAKDKSKPFRVMSGNQMVEVLGTHFNINSYADEGNIKTTLVEGRVKVHSAAKTNTDLILVPGQQAINTGQLMSLNANPDIEEIISWKEGSFQFNDSSLSSIMRQLSRWYDVDVEFVGQVPDYHFRGRISRDTPITQIFEILKTGGLNFTIEGRRIIVRD